MVYREAKAGMDVVVVRGPRIGNVGVVKGKGLATGEAFKDMEGPQQVVVVDHTEEINSVAYWPQDLTLIENSPRA